MGIPWKSVVPRRGFAARARGLRRRLRNARCERDALRADAEEMETAARLPPAYHSWLRKQGVAHAGVRFCAAPGRGTYGVASTDVGAGSGFDDRKASRAFRRDCSYTIWDDGI